MSVRGGALKRYSIWCRQTHGHDPIEAEDGSWVLFKDAQSEFERLTAGYYDDPRTQERDRKLVELSNKVKQLHSALAGEVGLVQLLMARPQLTDTERLTILANYRHLDSLEALSESNEPLPD
jgi:hypothetical protein